LVSAEVDEVSGGSIGSAPLAAVLRAPPYTSLLPQPGQEVARQAAALAGAGKLFVVLPGDVPLTALETLRRKHITSESNSPILVLLAAFMGALPARFQPTVVHSWPGLHRVTVYVFQG
jgi:hypothetical protein